MAIPTKLWNMSGDQSITNFTEAPELVIKAGPKGRHKPAHAPGHCF